MFLSSAAAIIPASIVDSLIDQRYVAEAEADEEEEAFTTTPVGRPAVAAAAEDDDDEAEAAGDLAYYPDLTSSELETVAAAAEAKECESPFPFWTFLGGLLMGATAAVLSTLAVQAFLRRRKEKSYNVPYTFDTFVNP